MARSPLSFTIDDTAFQTVVRKMRRELPELSRRRVAFAILLEWLRRIILRWPVDTGRSRSAWGVSIEALGETFTPVGNDPSAQAKGFQMGMFEDMSSGFRIVLRAVNAVEYSPFLEDGTSDQAPAGAVFISLQEILTGRIPEKEFQVIAKRWAALGVQANSRNTRRALRARSQRTGRAFR